LYTPPDSSSQFIDENEPSWPIGTGRQLPTPYRAGMMFDLHMRIYNELVNLGPHWHFPMAPCWHAPTKHANISMGDLGKPPRYEGSTNCKPCRGVQSVNSKGENIGLKPFSLLLKVCQQVCFFKNLNMCNPNICCFDAFDRLHVIGVTWPRWQFKSKSDNNESLMKAIRVNQKPT
jgi:hypothetical protein